MAAIASEDVFSLVCGLHRQALVCLSAAVDTPIQGLSQGSKKMPPSWRRKLRNLEAAHGIVRHITPQTVKEFMHKLEGALRDDAVVKEPPVKKAAAETAYTMKTMNKSEKHSPKNTTPSKQCVTFETRNHERLNQEMVEQQGKMQKMEEQFDQRLTALWSSFDHRLSEFKASFTQNLESFADNIQRANNQVTSQSLKEVSLQCGEALQKLRKQQEESQDELAERMDGMDDFVDTTRREFELLRQDMDAAKQHIMVSDSAPRGTREVCRFFAQGYCSSGTACRFVHEKGNS